MTGSAILLFICLGNVLTLSVHGDKGPKETQEEALQKEIHERLTPVELRSIFGTEDFTQVPEYNVVHPVIVDEYAKLNTNAQRSLHDSKPLYIHFHAFGLDFHLNITRNTKHVPANQVIEHHNKDGVTRIAGRPLTSSTGKITSNSNSKVVLDHTNGLSGMISRDEGTFLISPIPSHIANVKRSHDPHGAHVIYKRSISPENAYDDVESRLQDLKRSRERRSTSTRKEKNMELMIVADVNMVKFYGKDFLQPYLVNQGNLINSFFTDPTLSWPINVYLTRIVLLDEDLFAGAKSMMQLLPKFRNWLYKNNPGNDSDPLHVDNAVLYTKGGCANGCALSGFASVGMCGSGDSVVKDLGLMTALVATHEIAHNLGLDHDGGYPPENCTNGIHIMATSNTVDGRGFEWSKCSSEVLATYLGLYSSCLDDKPLLLGSKPTNTTDSQPANTQLYGKIYDANKQCQLAFGNAYRHCTYYAHICQTLMCETQSHGLCTKTLYPAAHGTWCGQHKWCIFGECVRDGTTPAPPINGGWTEFSDYLPCNRPCGGGATWKQRTCTNPAPKNGGKACVGKSTKDKKACNLQACPAGTKTFRQDQCAAISPEKVVVMDRARPCVLICKTPSQSAWEHGTVKDGTVTSAARTGVCIDGVIREVGCDMKMESGAVHDRCGVCGGDGSTCTRKSGNDTTHYRNDGEQHELFTIPKGAWEITVEEMGSTGRYLGLKVGNSNELAYWLPSWTTTVNAAGTKVEYIMNDYDFPDKIFIKGKIIDKIRIFYVDIYGYPALGVKWKYFMPAEGDVSATEYFAVTKWGPCSKTCAGGTQTRKVQCRRKDDKSVVSLAFCASNPKMASVQACNTQACPAVWYAYPWSSCSKSCGRGIKTRRHTCSELRADQKYHTIDDSSCKTTKPKLFTEIPCNIFACVAEWIPGEWSACSTTCNAGIRTRKITCKRTKADGTVVVVHDLECSSMLKSPPTQETCNADKPCSGWTIKFSPCSKECGGGIMTPFAACTLKDRECPADQKPDLKSVEPKACNTHACPTYAWVASYGDCVAKCDSGKRTMIVRCKDSNGKKVSSDICIKKKKTFPAQKECTNLPACAVGDATSGADYYLVGCYWDNRGSRNVPDYLGSFRNTIDWNNMAPTVEKCASSASSKSYTYFALQFYGECWAGGKDVSKTYDIDGPSDKCYMGTGGIKVNFVYRFGKRRLLPPVLPVGCYNATFKHMVKDFKDEIDWTKPIDDATIIKISSKCAIAAASKGYAAFGLKYPGQCWSGPLAQVSYNQGGPSDACKSELGGPDAYYVYKFIRQR